MEINKEVPWNPIKQDVKNGALRDYPMVSVVHYGASPRTYEHPGEKDEVTGLDGDGDPVDVLDISEMPVRSGEVYPVKVLGALAMEDDNAADWKIITIRADDPAAKQINGKHVWTESGEHSTCVFADGVPSLCLADLAEVDHVGHVTVTRDANGERTRTMTMRDPPTGKSLGRLQSKVLDKLELIRNFFRDYKKKKPEDPSPVAFAYNGIYLDAETAVSVMRHHHIHWCNLVDASTQGHRVGMLSNQVHEYQRACDYARSKWAAELDSQEAPGAGAGSQQASVPEGVWLPIDVDQL